MDAKKRKFLQFTIFSIFLILLLNNVNAELAGATPEAYSFSRPPGESISLFTGDMSLGIPLMTVPGRGGLSYPVTLSYSAGIKVGEEASWVGLGWDFAPGAITRSVNGIPDDYNSDQKYNYAFERVSITPGFTDDVSNTPDNFFGTPADVSGCSYSAESGGMLCKRVSDTDVGGALPSGSASETIDGFANNVGEESGYRSLSGFLNLGTRIEPNLDIKNLDRLNPDSYSVAGLGLSGSLILSGENDIANLNREFHMKDSSGMIDSSRDDPIKIEYFLFTDDDKQVKEESNELGERTSSKDTIKSFIITTKDGTKFYYDYPVYNVNKEGKSAVSQKAELGGYGNIIEDPDTKPIIDKDYVSVSYTRSETGDSKFIQYMTQKFAYAWLLTKIERPDGNWIKFNYKKVYYGDSDKGEPGPFEYRTPFSGGDSSIQDKKLRFERGLRVNCPNSAVRDVDQQSCSETFSHGYMEIAYLDSIETPTHKAEFVTSNRNDNVEYDFNRPEFIGDKKTKKLDEIKLLSNGNLVSEVRFSYDYSMNPGIPNNAVKTEGSSERNSEGRLTLKSIQQFDRNGNQLPATTFYYPGDYTSDYGIQIGDSSDNPSYQSDPIRMTSSDSTDYRFDSDGYFWLDGTTNSHYIGDRRLNEFGRTQHLEVGRLVSDQINGKTLANVDHADAWSLKGICWPSGSCTKYEYEIDRYGSVGVSRTTGASKTGDLYQSIEGSAGTCLHYGGGIRINQIDIYPNGFSGNAIFKKFFYRNDNRLESEREPSQQFLKSGSTNCPDMIDEQGIPLPDGSESSGVLSYRPYSILSNFNPRFVGYSKVTEKIGNNKGYTVHEFTTAKDYPPKPLTSADPKARDRKLIVNFEDTSSLWGLEKQTASYDNQGSVVSQVTNTYDTTNVQQAQSTWADVCSLTNNCHPSDTYREEKVSSYWIKPTRTEEITDGVKKVVTYDNYDPVNGLNLQVTEINPVTGNRVTVTTYAYNRYPGMTAKHIIDKPNEVTIYKNSVDVGNAVSAFRNEYWNSKYNYFPIKKTAVFDNLNSKWIETEFLAYDKYGNLIKVKDPLGRENEFAYDDKYKGAYLTKEKNPLGYEVKAEYDPDFGVIVKLVDPNGLTNNYEYDGFGRLTGVIRDGELIGQYAYDDASFDWRRSVKKINDNQNLDITEFFDGYSRNIKILSENGDNDIITEVEYDQDFIDKVSIAYKPRFENQPLGENTRNEYENSPLGRVLAIDPPGEGLIKTDYSNEGDSLSKVSVTDEEDKITTSLSDVFGKLIGVKEPSISAQTYNVNVASLTKNAQSNLLTGSAVADLDTCSDSGRTPVGSLSDTGTNRYICANYQGTNQIIQCWGGDNNPYVGLTLNGWACQRWGWYCGNTIGPSHGGYCCDGVIQQEACTTEIALSMPSTEDSLAAVESIEPNLEVNGAQESDGQTIEQPIIAPPQITLETKTINIPSAEGGITRYEYDILGNLIRIIDANGRIASNVYDSLNRLIQSNHPDTGTVNFVYDDKGNLISKTDARRVTINYQYDNLDRVIKVDYPDTKDTINKYDNCANGKGRLCEIEDASGFTKFEYDKKGRIIKVIKRIDLINEEFTTTYSYDSADNIISITSPDGRTRILAYDNLNRLESVSLDGSITVAYTYNPTNTINDVRFGNSIVTSYGYNPREWVNVIDSGEVLKRYLEYDKVGNVMSIHNSISNDNPIGQFAYDELNRLTLVKDFNYFGSDAAFTYDLVGNRLSKNGNDYSYKPDNNQLINAEGEDYEYDAVGNVIRRGEVSFNYDEDNRITQAAGPGFTDSFIYDSGGIRVAKQDTKGTTVYIYDITGNLIYEKAFLNQQPTATPENTTLNTTLSTEEVPVAEDGTSPAIPFVSG